MRKRGKSFARHVDPQAALRAFRGFRPLDESQKTDLGIAYRGAFERLRTGMADDDDMHTLAAALNTAMVMCELDLGAEYLADVQAAQSDVLRVYARSKEAQRWALDAQSLATLRRAFELHDEQLRICSTREIRRALDTVADRIRAGQVSAA